MIDIDKTVEFQYDLKFSRDNTVVVQILNRIMKLVMSCRIKYGISNTLWKWMF
jgi:hypothetical protein